MTCSGGMPAQCIVGVLEGDGLNRWVRFNRADQLRLLTGLVVCGLLFVAGVTPLIGTVFAAEPYPAVTINWSVYRDAQFGFSLNYPGDWALFRLFDEAKQSNEVCSWEFPTRAGPSFTVRYALSGDGADFIRSGHFSRFRCPSQVCQ